MAVKGSLLTVELPLKPHWEQERKLNLILSACRVGDFPASFRDLNRENDLSDAILGLLERNIIALGEFAQSG